MGSIYTNTLKSCMDLGAGAVPNCLFVYDMYNAVCKLLIEIR